MNSREICVSLHAAPQGFPILIQPHIPDRSGLPSAVRGAGAARLGVPSDFFGTSFVGYPSHWPCKAGVMASAKSTAVESTLVGPGTIRNCTVMSTPESENANPASLAAGALTPQSSVRRSPASTPNLYRLTGIKLNPVFAGYANAAPVGTVLSAFSAGAITGPAPNCS